MRLTDEQGQEYEFEDQDIATIKKLARITKSTITKPVDSWPKGKLPKELKTHVGTSAIQDPPSNYEIACKTNEIIEYLKSWKELSDE